ncbi:T9SS type A sorting domain-containing protein [Kordia sp. YSTF-M3]|uniref:T9SS type A sorting domain-containing protein n=1 Tax=Kordia aestuariivivens TaxID=2759037 RepID=A0ABR7QG84_9FLAO|nr:zinc-dependent metalloprotease [Kordia aestuariivivens]MBC8757595.1 T9SS type A sorting domain-containing protein [Kordia aestuariivivens]
MKKVYVSMLLLLFGMTFMVAQTLKPVAAEVVNTKAKGTSFTDVSSLIQLQENKEQLTGLKDASKVSLFMYNQDFFQNSLANQKKRAISMTLPLETNFSVVVDLVEVSQSFYDYTVTTLSGKEHSKNDIAKHYRGIVRGKESTSIVAVSFFNSQMMGTVSIEGKGSYNIGKLRNKDSHIIFNSENVQNESFACDEVDAGGGDALPYTVGDIMTSNPSDSMDKCIKIYFEVDYDIYQHFSSNTADVENFVIGLFNQTATIYLNESVNVEISEIFVWDTQDPYTSSSSVTNLFTFRTTRPAYNGDLAHLLTYRSSSAGGVAFVNGLCSENASYGHTSLFPSFASYPTYSRQVKVVTHEIGHNLGSRHTHDCVWNGNSTQIDDYGSVLPSGTPNNPQPCFTAPGITNVTPTIMSYFDSYGHGTFPMSNGFGTQPGNVIRNTVANADCIDECEGNCTAEVSYTINGAPITSPGSYTIEECLFQCVTVAANGDVSSVTYTSNGNVTSPSAGVFCVQPGGTNSFTVDIAGIDTCDDPFNETVTINVTPCTHENCCDADNNLLSNGNFDNASCTGSTAFGDGCVVDWTAVAGSPSLHGVDRFAWMWSYGGGGEAIEANFNFEEGVTYDICFRLLTDDRNTGDPNVANNATVNLVATNSPGNVTATPNGQIIFQNTMGDYLNNWQNVTLKFTPDADYTHLWIFPFMANASDGTSQSEMSIDDIVISTCCDDEPEIVPYWQHPNCPEVVCTADQWPIHVLSADGTPITSAGGVIISWDNLDTAVNENILADWIYASPGEHWQATITYPNGCEYIITYLEDCCDEDIFIKVLECPSDDQLLTYEASIKERMEKSIESKAVSQLQDELDLLHAYMNARVDGEDCDPCELGIVFIELVDANGDPIDLSIYDTFSWSDGGFGAMRAFPLPMAGPVCFTATNIEYGKECVYQDCFFYECEDPCGVPTNLQYDCRRANLTWTGDATQTYTVEVNWDDPACCRGGANPTSSRWEVTGTSFQLPFINQSGCFSWRVGVKCKDEIVWSDLACGSCDTRPQEPGPGTSVKTSAKISPNPNDGNMNIEISGNDKTPFTVKVYRFDGVLIKTFNENRIENQSITISWNGKSVLSKGMYFFVITTDKETITKKVIIE